jgi:GNAT superfamily N-acetyltransferase
MKVELMSEGNQSSICRVRPADSSDHDAVLQLATNFATSFQVRAESFGTSFRHLLHSPSACLAVAQSEDRIVGYILGFEHLTFFAGGPIAWVEEIMVHEMFRRCGNGRALMSFFEIWALKRRCTLVALATRRAGAFYESLGYDSSASYFRKTLNPPLGS